MRLIERMFHALIVIYTALFLETLVRQHARSEFLQRRRAVRRKPLIPHLFDGDDNFIVLFKISVDPFQQFSNHKYLLYTSIAASGGIESRPTSIAASGGIESRPTSMRR